MAAHEEAQCDPGLDNQKKNSACGRQGQWSRPTNAPEIDALLDRRFIIASRIFAPHTRWVAYVTPSRALAVLSGRRTQPEYLKAADVLAAVRVVAIGVDIGEVGARATTRIERWDDVPSVSASYPQGA
jgi:hypothetical protein